MFHNNEKIHDLCINLRIETVARILKVQQPTYYYKDVKKYILKCFYAQKLE